MSSNNHLNITFKEGMIDLGLPHLRLTSVGRRVSLFEKRGRRQITAWRKFLDYRRKRIPKRVLHMTKETYNRLTGFYLSILDSVLLSTPELVRADGTIDSSFLLKIRRWVYTAECRGRIGSVYPSMQKAWKRFILHVKQLVLTGTSKVELDTSVPFCRFGAFEHWLLEPSMRWLSSLIRGERCKTKMTRFSHFCCTRGSPCPTKEMEEAGLEDHFSIVVERKPEVQPLVLERCVEAGIQISADLISQKGFRAPYESHLSLTNSACFENPSSEGGRATHVARSLREFLVESPVTDRRVTALWGTSLVELATLPRFHTMFIDEKTRPKKDAKLLESSYEMIVPEDIFSDPVYCEPVYGLQKHIGVQILQWSVHAACKHGYICHDHICNCPFMGSVLKPPPVRPSIVGEPGGKARVVTVSESWLTILLTPFGHTLVECLRQHPLSRSGLSRAAMGWEWFKLNANLDEPDQEWKFLTSDFTQASENINHEYGKQLLRVFLTGIYGGLTPYQELCINLLLSPREYISDIGVDYTCRGSLMGDPGTKGMLMLHVLAAEYMSFRLYSDVHIRNQRYSLESSPNFRKRFFAAGDDVFAFGPEDYLKGFLTASKSIDMVFNEDKYIVSSWGGFLCEESLVRLPRTKFCWENAVKASVSSYEETCHIDAMKVRLISPIQKSSSDNTTNPLYGKAGDFIKKLSWLPKDFRPVRAVAGALFRARYNCYVTNTLMAYVPYRYGGLGIPLPNENTLKSILLGTSRTLKVALLEYFRGTLSANFTTIFNTFRSRTSVRGASIKDFAIEEVKMLFSNSIYALKKPAMLEKIADELGIRYDLGHRELCRHAFRLGYLCSTSFESTIQKPILMKELLSADKSLQIYNLEEYKALLDLRQVFERYISEKEITFSSYLKEFPEFAKRWQEAQNQFRTRGFRIETVMFEKLENPDALDKAVDFRKEVDQTSRGKQQRLLFALLMANYEPPEIEDLDNELANRLILSQDAKDNWNSPPAEDIFFIKKEKLLEGLPSFMVEELNHSFPRES